MWVDLWVVCTVHLVLIHCAPREILVGWGPRTEVGSLGGRRTVHLVLTDCAS